jgi:hypothetical protein
MEMRFGITNRLGHVGFALGVVLAAIIAVPVRGDADANRSLFTASTVSDGLAQSARRAFRVRAADAGVTRSRLVRWDTTVLQQSRAPGSRFRVELQDEGPVLDVVVDRHYATAHGSLVWHGSDPTRPGSAITLVKRHGVLVGDVRMPGSAVYRIAPMRDDLPGFSRIEERAPLPENWCGTSHVQRQARGNCMFGLCVSPIVQSVEVLVLYTPEAKEAAGGVAGIEATIELNVAWMNQAFDNSNINSLIRLVRMAEVDYEEPKDFDQTLDALTCKEIPIKNDLLHDTECMLDHHGADLMSLVVAHGEAGSSRVGLAWMMPQADSGYPFCSGDQDVVYSVVKYDDPLIFAHELGHNMGCAHEEDNDGFFEFSNAWSGPGFTTIMYSQAGSNIQHYSNPDVDFDGEPTGAAGEADNAGTLDYTAHVVANYEDRKPEWESEVAADNDSEYPCFGRNISCDGRWLAIAHPCYFFPDAGSLGVISMHFKDTDFLIGCTWGQRDVLVPPEDHGQVSNAGLASLDTSGDRVIFSTDGLSQNDDGIVYIHKYDSGLDGFVMEGRLTDPVAVNPNPWFGRQVSIDGSIAIVGGQWDYSPICVYRRSGGEWQFEQVLHAQSGLGAANLPMSVSNNRIALTVPQYQQYFGSPMMRGAAIFVYDDDAGTWQMQQLALRPMGQAFNYEGQAFGVCMEGDWLAVYRGYRRVYPDGWPGVQAGVDFWRHNPAFPASPWVFHSSLEIADVAPVGIWWAQLDIDISGTMLVVGDAGAGAIDQQGAVHVAEYSAGSDSWSWTESFDGAPMAYGRFGWSAAAHHSYVLSASSPPGVAEDEYVSIYYHTPGGALGAPDCTLEITQHPIDTTRPIGGSAQFHVAANADNGGPYLYQWRKDGVDLQDASSVPGSTAYVADAHAATLVVTYLDMAAVGDYECWVTRPGCIAGSMQASLTVVPPLPADCAPGPPDGQVNVTDLLELLSQWGGFNGSCDIDDNGPVNVSDLLLLLGSWGSYL